MAIYRITILIVRMMKTLNMTYKGFVCELLRISHDDSTHILPSVPVVCKESVNVYIRA